MAISLGYGILFATVITLVLVPSVYLIVEDVLGIIRSKVPSRSPVGEEIERAM
jgi:hypothetical protein